MGFSLIVCYMGNWRMALYRLVTEILSIFFQIWTQIQSFTFGWKESFAQAIGESIWGRLTRQGPRWTTYHTDLNYSQLIKLYSADFLEPTISDEIYFSAQSQITYYHKGISNFDGVSRVSLLTKTDIWCWILQNNLSVFFQTHKVWGTQKMPVVTEEMCCTRGILTSFLVPHKTGCQSWDL